MNENFIRERIIELRINEKLSAQELSLRLGQAKGYINTIEKGKSLPSLESLLNICEYFQITPYEFFNENIEYPKVVNDVREICLNLDEETLKSILVLLSKIDK